MNEQEKKDLDVMLVSISQIKDNFFSLGKMIVRATPDELQLYGYSGKTNAEALLISFKDQLAKIDKLHKEHVKKYPD